jgi:hypothetical protein
MIEAADQSKQSGERSRFMPVIENGVKRRLALHRAYDGAEDDGHPQQPGEASVEAYAAKRSKNNQNARAQAKSE